MMTSAASLSGDRPGMVTVHRPADVDDTRRLETIAMALPTEHPVILPAQPWRTRPPFREAVLGSSGVHRARGLRAVASRTKRCSESATAPFER